MGKIIILAKNFHENASGSIRDDGAHITNQSEKKVVQNGAKGINNDKNKDRKPPTDIRIAKVEGPFDGNGKLVDKIVLGTSYVFKATPTRKPKKEEIALLKWSVKFDDAKKLIINGVASLNKSEGDKIIIPLKITGDFEKGRVYAFYQKPTDDASVGLSLKKIKFPMLILQSISRKGKKTIVNSKGTKESSNETAVDLLFNDYPENSFGFKKLRDEIYKESLEAHKKDNISDFSLREKEALNKANLVIEKVKLFCKKNDSELFEIFKYDAELQFSAGKLQDNIDRMILKMQNNEGKEYSHTDLTAAVVEHENTKLFISQVKKWTIAYLKLDKFKSNIEALRITDNSEGIIYNSNFKEEVNKPRFNNVSDKFSGIQIATNDIWAYQIYLTKYYLENNEPHGELQLDFYDHFGLDYPDIEKYDNDIFISWFVLQHFRGYKPFITKISFNTKF